MNERRRFRRRFSRHTTRCRSLGVVVVVLACNVPYEYYEAQQHNRLLKYFISTTHQHKYIFLSSIDFSMIMVWWFESGMIEWLWCDGLEVVYVNEYNWRNCKQLWTKYTHFFSFSSNSEIPHKALFKFSVFATFSYQEMTWQYPEDLWRPGH